MTFKIGSKLSPGDIYYTAVGMFEASGFERHAVIEGQPDLDHPSELARVYKQKVENKYYVIHYPGKDHDNPRVAGFLLKDISNEINKIIAERGLSAHELIKIYPICQCGKLSLLDSLDLNIIQRIPIFWRVSPLVQYVAAVQHFTLAITYENVEAWHQDSIRFRGYSLDAIQEAISSNHLHEKYTQQQSLLNSWECGYHALNAIRALIDSGFHITRAIDEFLVCEYQNYYQTCVEVKCELINLEEEGVSASLGVFSSSPSGGVNSSLIEISEEKVNKSPEEFSFSSPRNASVSPVASCMDFRLAVKDFPSMAWKVGEQYSRPACDDQGKELDEEKYAFGDLGFIVQEHVEAANAYLACNKQQCLHFFSTHGKKGRQAAIHYRKTITAAYKCWYKNHMTEQKFLQYLYAETIAFLTGEKSQKNIADQTYCYPSATFSKSTGRFAYFKTVMFNNLTYENRVKECFSCKWFVNSGYGKLLLGFLLLSSVLAITALIVSTTFGAGSIPIIFNILNYVAFFQKTVGIFASYAIASSPAVLAGLGFLAGYGARAKFEKINTQSDDNLSINSELVRCALSYERSMSKSLSERL